MNSKMISILVVLMMCLPVFAAADVSAVPGPQTVPEEDAADETDYVRGEILVKDRLFSQKELNIPYVGTSPVYPGSHWHKVVLVDGTDTVAALNAVKASGRFENATLNSIIEIQSVDVSGNPGVSRSQYLDSMGIKAAWDAMEAEGVTPGGDRSIVVAVVDTGVDYDHEDLKDNIWHNPGEIPDNGIDDDDNGFIDDAIGWNFGRNNNDPRDSYGHGTHVSGIIAAENNSLGTVGVAFNCQIMCLRTTYEDAKLDAAAIGAAVMYAKDQGADVINMSLGLVDRYPVVDDAVKDCWDSCIVVAAAGNDGNCNNTDHKKLHASQPMLPGSSGYAIGVMSATQDGSEQSWFSNYDDTPYDSTEYDTYAVGSEVYSTYPDNQYRNLDGTSMACPVISGIAALLLSMDPERKDITLNMVRSALVNSGTIHPMNQTLGEIDRYHALCDAGMAMDILKNGTAPFVNAQTPYSFYGPEGETGGLNFKNLAAGQDGFLGADVMNRGYSAEDVTMSLTVSDERIRFDPAPISFGNMGPYETVHCGMDAGDMSHAFKLYVSPDIPHGTIVDCRLNVTYSDPGVPGSELTTSRSFKIMVTNDVVLPSVISADMVCDRDHRYVMDGDVTVSAGATVKFLDGSKLVHSAGDEIRVEGTLEFRGLADSRISINGSEDHPAIKLASEQAKLILDHCDITDFRTVSPYSNNNEMMYFNGCNMVFTKEPQIWGDAMDVANFDNSYMRGNEHTVRISGAIGSVFDLKHSLEELTFDAAPVRDTVVVCSMQSFYLPQINLQADAERVLFNSTVMNSGWEFTKAEGAVLKDLCFEGGFSDTASLPSIPFSQLDVSKMWPMVIGVQVVNEDGTVPEVISNSKYQMRLEFSRPMNADVEPEVGWTNDHSEREDDQFTEGGFASDAVWQSCGDKTSEGHFVSDTVWQGDVDMSLESLSGKIRIYVDGAQLLADGFKKNVPTYGQIGFGMVRDDSACMWVEPMEAGSGAEIWFQFPEYVKSAGVNVYRSDSQDGELTRLNEAMLIPSVISMEDPTAQPGKTYWYTVACVDVGLEEGPHQPMVAFTVPRIVHQVSETLMSGADAVLTCTVTGDFQTETVQLHYMHDGGWKKADMELNDGSYTVTVPAEDVTGEEFVYYISASDDPKTSPSTLIHTITCGSGIEPMTVTLEQQQDLTVMIGAAAIALLSAILIAVFRR